MKQRHLLSLLQSGFTTIRVYVPGDAKTHPPMPQAPRSAREYDQHPHTPAPWEVHYGQQIEKPAPAPLYTYKCPLDAGVKEGDYVVVPRETLPGKVDMLLAVVHKVDVTPQIDIDADFDYKWIVQRIDFGPYNTRVTQEQNFREQLQEVERQHQRDQLALKMAEHLPEGTEARKLFDAAVGMFQQTFSLPLQAQPQQPNGPQTAYQQFPQAPAPQAEQPMPGVACK